MKYPDWTLIAWDGNPALKLQCWRKSFGRGHVSIGAGNFHLICYSHGANSDDSLSGTRNRGTYIMAEETAKAMVDRNRGYYNFRDNN